jgi:hypothetical protein
MLANTFFRDQLASLVGRSAGWFASQHLEVEVELAIVLAPAYGAAAALCALRFTLSYTVKGTCAFHRICQRVVQQCLWFHVTAVLEIYD